MITVVLRPCVTVLVTRHLTYYREIKSSYISSPSCSCSPPSDLVVLVPGERGVHASRVVLARRGRHVQPLQVFRQRQRRRRTAERRAQGLVGAPVAELARPQPPVARRPRPLDGPP